jgi:archaetidylinositol phosphate synthase
VDLGDQVSETFFLGKELSGARTPSIRTETSIRIETHLLAQPERKLLNWLCVRMPSAVTPDRLTGFGFVGAVLVFAGYLASDIYPAFFWLATLGIVANWFGDSLDGSLARHRRIEKSRYGYFLDHSVDALSVSLILLGLGLSAYVQLDVALFALLGYLMMCIYVFLSNHVTGKFELSFLALGPTEMRIVLIGLNSLMYFSGNLRILIGHEAFSVYDIFVFCSGVCLVCLYIASTLTMAWRLRWEDASLPPYKQAHFRKSTLS